MGMTDKTLCSKCKESEEYIDTLKAKIADLEQVVVFYKELDDK